MTINTTPPSFRKTSVRKAMAERRSTEKKAHRGETQHFERKQDPVEKFRDSRQDRFISSLSANLNVMIQAVQKAGRGLARDFGELENLQVSKKGAADFASAADLNAEKALKEHLQKARPKYGFVLEEGGVVKGSDTSHNWIIDPLDGTTNFLHALPHFAISLALQEDKEIIAGVIYNPISGDLFYAEKGGGAWAMTASGSCRLHVSNRNKLNEAVVVTGIPHLGHGSPDKFILQLMPMMEKTAGVRRMGSASLDMAYVAAGRFECYWEEGIKPWDIAAGLLIVKEAGGRICTFKGDEDPFSILKDGTIVATNDLLFNTVKKQITAIEKDAKK